MGSFSSYANQRYHPELHSALIFTFVWNETTFTLELPASVLLGLSSANLYLNCVICYEILALLRNSYRAVRVKPPTYRKVTIQALSVYTLLTIIFVIEYYLGKKRIHARHANANLYDKLRIIQLTFNILLTYIFPIGYFVYVCIAIKIGGFMSSATGGMKQLVCVYRGMYYNAL